MAPPTGQILFLPKISKLGTKYMTRPGLWERKDKLLKRKDELLPSISFFFIFRSKFIVTKRRDSEEKR